MKLSEMQNIQKSRENVMGFLHHTDIAVINAIVNQDVSKKSFNEVCELTIALYQEKAITNKKATAVFEILKKENTNFRTERFRLTSAHEIYIYNEEKNVYICYCTGGQKKLKELIAKHGEYI